MVNKSDFVQHNWCVFDTFRTTAKIFGTEECIYADLLFFLGENKVKVPRFTVFSFCLLFSRFCGSAAASCCFKSSVLFCVWMEQLEASPCDPTQRASSSVLPPTFTNSPLGTVLPHHLIFPPWALFFRRDFVLKGFTLCYLTRLQLIVTVFFSFFKVQLVFSGSVL